MFFGLDIMNFFVIQFDSRAILFHVEVGELPLGISIGPVIGATLSRVALVNTNIQLRAFSLETGQVGS